MRARCTGATLTVPGSPYCHVPVPDSPASSPSSWTPVTLAEHKTLAVRDETRADSPDPNLTDVEAAALAALSGEDGTHLRLEQERLPLPFVLSRLSTAMEADDPDQVPCEYRRDYAEIDFSDDEPTISTVRRPGPAAVQPIPRVSD